MLEKYLNKITCCNCLDLMKELSDNSVDCVITSPPYNKNGFRGGKRDTGRSSEKYKRWDGAKIDYDNYDDNLQEEEYQKWQVNILDEIYRILKPTGSLFYNHKVRRFNNKANHPITWLDKSKLNFYQQIIWERNGSPDQNINYCTPTTELILWFVKDNPKVFKYGNLNEVWQMNFETNSHPAPFPIILPERCIRLTTEENDIVLDPFIGSGTTAVACKNLKRNFIGFEISERYCEIARQRLRQEILI